MSHKNTLSRAYIQSVKQWDRTAHEVWEQTIKNFNDTKERIRIVHDIDYQFTY